MRSFYVFLLSLLISGFAHAEPTTRKIELLETFQPPVQNGSADLLIPLPMRGSSYQKVLSETHESNATWVKEEQIQNGPDSIRVLHAHWNNCDKPADHLKPTIKVREVISLSDRDSGSPAQKADGYFLKPSDHVQTDGIVRDTAADITKGLTDPDAKARAVYDWIVEHTTRDPKVRGCGTGDVKSTLKAGNLSGKCADLNSLFVGLARAAGISAREIWGLRVAPSTRSKSLGKEGDVSKGQHCRAEYYSSGKKAWIPVDPADVRKVMLEENLTLTDPHVLELRERMFGTWEGNWVALNFGRDVEMPNGKKMNFLMYPQLVAGALAPDGVDPAEVGYSFSASVLKN